MTGSYSRSCMTLFALALYGGPVLAGLAGHRIQVLPVFAALFLMHSAAQHKPNLATGAGWAGLVIMGARQIVLVTATWGLGLLAAQVTTPVALPLWAPIGVSALAAGLGVWAFRDAAEMGVMLDSAIRALEEMDETARLAGHDPWPRAPDHASQAVVRMLGQLREIDTFDLAQIDPIVETLEDTAGADAFDPFYDAARQDEDANEPIVDFALLRFVALPAIRRQLIERGEAGLAPMLLLNAPHPLVRAEARGRVVDLIEADTPAEQLPDPVWLAELARTFPGEGFETLSPARAGR